MTRSNQESGKRANESIRGANKHAESNRGKWRRRRQFTGGYMRARWFTWSGVSSTETRVICENLGTAGVLGDKSARGVAWVWAAKWGQLETRTSTASLPHCPEIYSATLIEADRCSPRWTARDSQETSIVLSSVTFLLQMWGLPCAGYEANFFKLAAFRATCSEKRIWYRKLGF